MGCSHPVKCSSHGFREQTNVNPSSSVGVSQAIPSGSNVDASQSQFDRRKGIAQAEGVVNHEEGSEEEVEGFLSRRKRKLNVGTSDAANTGKTFIHGRNDCGDSQPNCMLIYPQIIYPSIAVFR